MACTERDRGTESWETTSRPLMFLLQPCDKILAKAKVCWEQFDVMCRFSLCVELPLKFFFLAFSQWTVLVLFCNIDARAILC